MRISQIHIYQYDLPVKNGPYTMSYGDIYSLDTTLIKITTDTGVIGWGETCPLGPVYAPAHASGARAALKTMAPGLIGTETFPVNVHCKMNLLLNGHAYAKAAVDIAVYDALGKSLGLRVSDLLGGTLAEHLPSYYAIGIETPENAARIAKEKCAEGYTRLQLKVASHPPELDIEVIKKVWEVIANKGVRFAIDANRGWKTRDAIQVSQACRDIPLIIEQPCDTIEELRQLRSLLHHPLYMDESSCDVNTIISTAASGLVDGFGLKLSRLGGLLPMTTVRDICAARNLPHTSDDTWGGDIRSAASAHLAATVRPDLLEGVWLAAPYIEGHYDSVNGLHTINGHIKLPQGPGLGIIPDETLFGESIAAF